MRVLKRSNVYEDISFDKVLRRLRSLCNEGIPLKSISPDEIAQRVCSRIYDGVKTTELDELASQMCASLVTKNPEYGTLASRIVISNHHKNTSDCFSVTIEKLYQAQLISEELYTIVQLHKDKLNNVIEYVRDYDLDYFGFKTLEKSYLLKIGTSIVERPQDMWMRVSLGIHGYSIDDAIETYNLMSKRYFTHATPTLFNAGTPSPQLSSCYLLSMHDSVTGMYKTLGDCAQISKYAGGIGVHIHSIRAKGSHIRGTNGISSGIIPMLRVYNNTARHINQAGKRNGSIAIYLEPWHADIESFLDLRKNNGSEEDRCRDLFTAMWIPDLFMERVHSNGDWCLMCPDVSPGLSDCIGDEFKKLYEQYEESGKYVKKVKAQTIWIAIIKSQIETGTPYLCYKDSANKKTNQKNLGIIKSSNLCVAPETKILTSEGYKTIRDLVNKDIKVWNGVEWSETTVHKTSDNSELVRIVFSEGTTLECTMYHKFHIQVGYNKKKNIIKSAEELSIGDRLIKWSPPISIEFENPVDFKYAYTHGLFCADGTYNIAYNGIDKYPSIALYGEKKNLIDKIEVHSCTYKPDASGRLNVQLPRDLETKYLVPLNASIKNRLEWLSGVIDGDGHAQYNPDNTMQISIGIASIHVDFLNNIKLLLHTLGATCCISMLHEAGMKEMPNGKGGNAEYYCEKCFRLIIPALSVTELIKLGIKTYRINLDNHEDCKQDNRHYVTVKSIERTGRFDETYCFNEPKRHMGIFNGVITGNCSEIMEYSDDNEYAVCNLASISLPAFIESGIFNFEKLHKISELVTRNLNKVIDRTFYPIPETSKSNLKHRPIGIGVQGLADAFAIMRFPFESPEAAKLNKCIFETIYHGALSASAELAKEYGEYITFKGSPASQGLLQFDLWGKQPEGNWDWDSLKKDIVKYGLRNSLLLAPMPTASTSQILGNTECFEPITSNIFQRQSMAGDFTIINKHLVTDLMNLCLWNDQMKDRILTGGGSIQNITEIPTEIKCLYKTAWEIKQKVLIDQAADRGIYICQSQSLNLFIEDPDISKISNMHFYAWRAGLKTGCYYLRTRPKARKSAYTLQPETSVKSQEVLSEAQLACSRENPENCVMCSG
jgi:ribonucleoside-diphosphate reductase alpha chain